MTDKEVLQRYVDLVPFLNKVFGDGSEIVVCDITHPDKSIIAIANPLSGRKLGNPMTDLARSLVAQGLDLEKDYIANYDGSAKNIKFLASTYFIRNGEKLIGLLCVNKNISASRELAGALISFFEANNLNTPENTIYHENLDTKVEDYVEQRVAQVIAMWGIAPERLNTKEKTNIVHKLNENGILRLKGAVEETAKQLDVSIPTIYRYLKK